MDVGYAVAVLAVLVALVLLVAYFALSRRERGSDPFYAEEVYLFTAAAAAAPPAGAVPATAAQAAAYTAAGGAARAGAAWLYGPKPREGTPGVAPFSAGRWFQPGP